MQKKNKILKIACLCCIVAILIGTLTITASADSSTLSPRDLLTPQIPLDKMYFTSTIYGTETQISTPFSLFSVNAGTVNDATRFPIVPNSAGTAVTGYETLYMEHIVTGAYNTSPKDITTRFRNLDIWGRLLSPYSTAERPNFETITLFYQDFLNPNFADPAVNNIVLQGNAYENQYSHKQIYASASYSYITKDTDTPVAETKSITVDREIIGTDFTNGASYRFTVPLGELLPDFEDPTYIINLKIVLRCRNLETGMWSTLYGLEEFSFTNRYIRQTEYEQILVQQMPLGMRYQQVVNTRDFSDLLDWLGDVMESVLTTELFAVGNISVTPAILLSTIVGLLLILMVLKFFAGG